MTIDVKDDSLAAAVAGVERGERWENANGYRLTIQGGRVVGVQGREGWIAHPHADGWHRVDGLLRCPRCGARIGVQRTLMGRDGYVVDRCCCGLSDRGYATEAEACVAWLRIGKPGLPWRRPSEKPKAETCCLVLNEHGSVSLAYFPFGDYVAWFPLSDLPLPSWATEGKA